MLQLEIISKAPVTTAKAYRQRTAYKQFVKWCVDNAVAPDKPNEYTVAGFLTNHCLQLGGSTASVDNKMSSLKLYFEEDLGADWLPPIGLAFVKRIVKVLKFDDYSKSKRKAPIQMGLLHEMIALRGTSTVLSLMLAAVYALHHDGLMRSGEGTSGLLAAEVTVAHFKDHKGRAREALEVMIDRTKTHREKDPVKITISDFDDQWSACKLIQRLKRVSGVGANDYLFPQVKFKRGAPSGLDWSKTLSYEALVICIKHDVELCGRDPVDFSGHSFRAGGATDLFASGELAFAQIMKVGRWRSLEACLIYYREDLEVAGRAGDVFGKQAGEFLTRV
jgi:hypothetical protein